MLWGGWGERKKSARGTMGRGKRDERPPFPSSHRPPRACYFFYYIILMQGHELLFDGDTQREPLGRREHISHF